jgi:hypothetical protein
MMNNEDVKTNAYGFYLVDFAARGQRGFRNNIAPVRSVPALMKKYRYYECYTTYFLYPEKIKEHVKKKCNTCTMTCSVSGYDGAAYAHYFPIDIDNKELQRAHQTAKQLVRFLLNEYLSDRKAILAYFSGSAGFHLMIDTRTFGEINPSVDINVTFSILRERLAGRSGADRDSIDFSIKDKLRLWRLPNTVNRKSGLFKIQLTIRDLFTLDTEQIMKKAVKLQPIFYTDQTGLIPLSCCIKTNRKAEAFYVESLEATKKRVKRPVTVKNIPTEGSFDINGTFCKAEQIMAENHIQEGLRNNAAVRLISKIKRKGFNRNEAVVFIRMWNHVYNIQLTDRELMSIVRSVYSRNKAYNYGCNDEILKRFCPHKDRNDCRDYRIYKIKNIPE